MTEGLFRELVDEEMGEPLKEGVVNRNNFKTSTNIDSIAIEITVERLYRYISALKSLESLRSLSLPHISITV